VFGPVGRALGYRATYDRYLEESFWRSGSDDGGNDDHGNLAAADLRLSDGGTGRIDGIEREVELFPE